MQNAIPKLVKIAAIGSLLDCDWPPNPPGGKSGLKRLPYSKTPYRPVFWEHVDKNGPIPSHCPELGACWVWTGTLNRKGYGVCAIKGKQYSAHRVSYVNSFGEIPILKPCVLHKCDNRPCVNPSHLWSGTVQDNTDDMVRKNRQGWSLAPEDRIRGERCGQSVLNNAKVILIRQLYASGTHSRAELARMFGVVHKTIRDVVSRKSWAHVQQPNDPFNPPA